MGMRVNHQVYTGGTHGSRSRGHLVVSFSQHTTPLSAMSSAPNPWRDECPTFADLRAHYFAACEREQSASFGLAQLKITQALAAVLKNPRPLTQSVDISVVNEADQACIKEWLLKKGYPSVYFRTYHIPSLTGDAPIPRVFVDIALPFGDKYN